jgi:hypothetical protein
MSALPPKADIGQRRAMTDHDPCPLFADGCIVIACYGGAKPDDVHLASTIHCVDEEIIARLRRRDRRRRDQNRLGVGRSYLVVELRLYREALVARVAQQFFHRRRQWPEFTATPTTNAVNLFLAEDCGR